jgi:polysaccharide deacetylase family protein (PEP-CTERM system associated)
MAGPVTFTLDLEDLRTSPTQESRVGPVTIRLLDRLAELSIRGTVFCVADVALRNPGLIARIAADGHEIAVHGLHHTPIDLLDPDAFTRETAEAKAVLEDLSGSVVTGYRAPQFSLVPETVWAVDILGDLGFAYSSSLLPAKSPLYGWPGAPRHPFVWSSGLIEFPCPLFDVGPLAIPFLGGAYARVLPKGLARRGLNAADSDSVLWTYCHPWEFDPGEKFYVYEHGGWLASRVGWANRRGMMGRIESVMAGGVGLPLGERAAGLVGLAVQTPSKAPATRKGFAGFLRSTGAQG